MLVKPKLIHIPADMWQQIDTLAKAEGRGATAVILDLLRQSLREKVREVELMKSLTEESK